MSPELRYNKIKADQGLEDQCTSVDWIKNDIFSLGLTFLEVLTLDSVENLNINSEIVNEKLHYLE